MKRLGSGAVVAFLGLALAGCGSERGGGSVEMPLRTLVLDEAPMLSIGEVDGDARYLLSGVSDATRQSDGTVVVANCQSSELRWFDGAGRFIRSRGGPGDGPGEFAFLRRLIRFGGDTLAAYDGRRARLTIISPEGEVDRIHSLTSLARGSNDVIGRLSNGRYVVRRFDSESVPSVEGPFRMNMKLLIVDEHGELLDSVSTLPGSDLYAMTGRAIALRMGRAAAFAVHPDGIYYGGQDEGGILEFDMTLARRATILPLTRSESVAPEMQESFERMLEAGAAWAPDGVGPAYARQYADAAPSHRDLIAGRDGRLWVEDPMRPNRHPLHWTAYESGEAVARVELPGRFFPLEFGADWVLGVTYDEMSVERVELWALVPGPHASRELTPAEAQPPAVPGCGSWASR